MKNKGSLIGVVLLVVGSLTVAATPAEAQKAKSVAEFSARVVATGQMGARGTARLQIVIDRWSTDAEREAILEAIKDDDVTSVHSKLASFEPVGYLREVTDRGYELRYAREFVQGDRRVIILATSRPITIYETAATTRSFKYNVSVVQLVVDKDGKGEGTLAPGVKIVFNSEKNQIEATDFSYAPFQLTAVTQTK